MARKAKAVTPKTAPKKPPPKKAAKKAPPKRPPAKSTEPDLPQELSGDVARRVWRELEADLRDRLSILSIDRRCLILYCNSWQLLTECQQTLAREGRYITIEESGYVSRHPAAIDEAKCVAQIRQLAAELGMSPKARKGVKVRSGEGDPLKAFLAARPPGG